MAKRQDRRNLHACHPIMRKGGVHEKSKSAKRAAAKHETRRKTTEWLSRSFFWLRFQALLRGGGLLVPHSHECHVVSIVLRTTFPSSTKKPH